MDNKELNKLPAWINKKCKYCKRGYPDTVLNIEGVIHFNGELKCLDVNDCNKYRRRHK